jgi:LysM repeat protein
VLCGGCAGKTGTTPDAQGSQEAGAFALAEVAVVPVAQEVAQGSTVLHFDPSPLQVAVGGVAEVRLRLENVENLYGLEAHLTFDKNVVQVEDSDLNQEGVQIAAGEIPYPEFTVQNIVDNLGGWLDYATVQLAPRPAANGSGVVATIRFKGVSQGTSPIHFTSAKLASPDGFAIPVTLQDGSIIVGEIVGPTPTPAPSVPPEPTATAPTEPTHTPGTPTPTPTPGATPSPAPPVCPTLYVVRTGDTAFSVSLRFGVSLEALAAANDLPASFRINIGQILVIPDVPGPVGEFHVVQAGETLYSISRQHNVSVETLAAVNGIPHPWHAPLGETLLICPP